MDDGSVDTDTDATLTEETGMAKVSSYLKAYNSELAGKGLIGKEESTDDDSTKAALLTPESMRTLESSLQSLQQTQGVNDRSLSGNKTGQRFSLVSTNSSATFHLIVFGWNAYLSSWLFLFDQQSVNVQTAVGVLVLSVAAAAVVWNAKAE